MSRTMIQQEQDELRDLIEKKRKELDPPEKIRAFLNNFKQDGGKMKRVLSPYTTIHPGSAMLEEIIWAWCADHDLGEEMAYKLVECCEGTRLLTDKELRAVAEALEQKPSYAYWKALQEHYVKATK